MELGGTVHEQLDHEVTHFVFQASKEKGIVIVVRKKPSIFFGLSFFAANIYAYFKTSTLVVYCAMCI